MPCVNAGDEPVTRHAKEAQLTSLTPSFHTSTVKLFLNQCPLILIPICDEVGQRPNLNC